MPNGAVSNRLGAVRDGVVDGAASGLRRYQWERVRRLLPPAFGPAWEAAAGVPGWFDKRQAAAFTLALQDLGPDPTVVEIGSYLGRSAVFQARVLEELGVRGNVTAIDPHTGDRQHLERLGLDELPTWDLFQYFVKSLDTGGRVDTVRATSMEAVENWEGGIDLLYVDGWHSYDAVKEDGERWLPFLKPDGVVVFDDYEKYTDDVGRAVDELAADGLFVPWGVNAVQMVGGRSARPPARLGELLSIVDSRTMQSLRRTKARLGGG